MHLKISAAKWCPFCPGKDELTLISSLNFHAPVLWHPDQDVSYVNMVFVSTLIRNAEENLAPQSNVNANKTCPFKEEGLKILGR